MRKKAILLTICAIVCHFGAFGQAITKNMSSEAVKKQRAVIASALDRYPPMFSQWRSESERKVKLEKVSVIPSRERIELFFNSPLAQIGIREDLVLQWEQMVRDTLNAKTNFRYDNVQVALYCENVPIERFIANAYRSKFARDPKRISKPTNITPLTRLSHRPVFGAGLELRHIALWPSHGYYFEQKDSSWKFQRPALFNVIEDLNSFEYCHRYLIPMLENAGAVVISPRERSTQSEEIIVDNDLIPNGSKIIKLSGKWTKMKGGFLHRDSIVFENPFTLGTHLSSEVPSSILYEATLPHSGKYTVSASYRASEQNSSHVVYQIEHTGGVTEVEVNQQVMGSTWVHLGEFDFSTNPKVTIIAKGDGMVTTDAVRFGGGMGSVVRGMIDENGQMRNGTTSKMPRWVEGARYAMQYSGVPSKVYSIGAIENQEDPKRKKDDPIHNDYADDYKSRGEWVNWLTSTQRLPIDLACAIHSNAGSNDTIFGTLTIHLANAGKESYSNGKSGFMGRDLADLVLTQIVDDLRILHTPQWTRRSIYDKSYAEISRPDVPSIIVEMFSHQDQTDMSFARQPQFKFDICRAIYKGILKFLADSYQKKYVVQPLPVNSLKMSLKDSSTIRLSWQPTLDKIEPTATPTHYKVYTRIGEKGGFDNGVTVRGGAKLDLAIVDDGVIRSYKVTALNDGGESFASEVLSCGFVKGATKVGVIENRCRQLSAQVPYIHDLGYVGEVYDNDPTSQFIDNLNPGFGASRMDAAVVGLAGESMDNTLEQGKRLLENGVSYISVSCQKQ